MKKHGKNTNQHFEKLVARFSELPEIEKNTCLDMRAFLHMVDVSVELDYWELKPQSCSGYPIVITQKQSKTHLCFPLSEIQRIGSSAKRLHYKMSLSLCLGLSTLTFMLVEVKKNIRLERLPAAIKLSRQACPGCTQGWFSY